MSAQLRASPLALVLISVKPPPPPPTPSSSGSLFLRLPRVCPAKMEKLAQLDPLAPLYVSLSLPCHFIYLQHRYYLIPFLRLHLEAVFVISISQTASIVALSGKKKSLTKLSVNHVTPSLTYRLSTSFEDYVSAN